MPVSSKGSPDTLQNAAKSFSAAGAVTRTSSVAPASVSTGVIWVFKMGIGQGTLSYRVCGQGRHNAVSPVS